MISKIFSSASLNLVIMVATLFTGIIPVFAGYDFGYWNTEENKNALKSEPILLATYAMIFANIPSILDIGFDIISAKQLRIKSSNDYFYGRLFIITGSFVTAVVSFIAVQSTNSPSSYQLSNSPAVYWICAWVYSVIIVCSLLYCVCISSPELFTVKLTASSSLLVCILATLRLYSRGTSGYFNVVVAVLITVVNILYLIAFVIYGKIMLTWSFKSSEVRISFFYFTATFAFLISITAWAISYWSLGKDSYCSKEPLSIAGMLSYIYAKLAWIILFTVVPSRLFQYEINEANVKVAETRADCSSFLIQKLREPLQSVYFGLLIMHDQIPYLYKSRDEIDILSDPLSGIFDEAINHIDHAFRIVSQASNDVTTAISNFSYYVEIDKGALSTRKTQNVDIRILIREALSVYEAQINSKCISVSQVYAKVENEGWMSFYDGAIFVEVDSDMIHQVLLNLISNAARCTLHNGTLKIVTYFSPAIRNDEGDTLRLETNPTSRLLFTQTGSNLLNRPQTINNINLNHAPVDPPTQPKPGFITVQIIDSGVGLSEIDQQKIFKQNIQLKPNLPEDPHHVIPTFGGLGLWVSKRIIEMHGGTISVFSSGEGRGSTFAVELPGRPISPGIDIMMPDSAYMEELDGYISDSQIDRMLHEAPSEFNCSSSFKCLSQLSQSNLGNIPVRVHQHYDTVLSLQIESNSNSNSIRSEIIFNSVAVSIEGFDDVLKVSVLNKLIQILNAIHIDNKMPEKEAHQLESDLQGYVKGVCSSGGNVVLNNYYRNHFQFHAIHGDQLSLPAVGAGASIYRPTYIFLLVSQSTTIEELDFYRQIGCYEILLSNSDTDDDIVENILSIIKDSGTVESYEIGISSGLPNFSSWTY